MQELVEFSLGYGVNWLRLVSMRPMRAKPSTASSGLAQPDNGGAGRRLRSALLAQLHNGHLRPGDKLPTERALCAEYALGRSTVRRVLGELKDLSLITQTVGSGTYVAERATVALAGLAADSPAAMTSPMELMEARMTFEPAVVDMVIRRATPADLQRMEHCCAQAEAAVTLEDFEYWDGLLHEVIADAAHNNFVSSVFRLMNHVRSQGDWGALKRRTVTPERRLAYQREHRALVEALKDRDVNRAVLAAREHLTHVRRNLLGY